MKGTKFIKGICTKTKRYFGLEIKQFGGTWKVVNFINLTPDQAALMTSEIRQSSFQTAENLQACAKCGNRVVGGCDCPKKSFDCTRSEKYNFQCVYCKQLQIDYSSPVIGRGYAEGDVIRLSQGQEVKIHLPDNKPLTKIYVGVGWDPARNDFDMDVDSSVIVAGTSDYETIYFGNLQHESGCVIHHGDNLTGIDRGGNVDDENITVNLDKVPSNRDRLIFVLNIYECAKRKQRLGDVKNMYIRLYDPVSNKAIIEYKVEDNMKDDTAIVIGTAYRQGKDWMFKAIGRGSRAKDIRELAQEVVRTR
jgi:stress response protein SCP2